MKYCKMNDRSFPDAIVDIQSQFKKDFAKSFKICVLWIAYHFNYLYI